MSRVLLNASYAPSLVLFRADLIRAMVERGHNVHVSAPDMDEAEAAAMRMIGAEPHPIRLRRSGITPFSDLVYWLAVYRLIRRIEADLVIGYTVKPNIWGGLAARMANVTSASLVTGLGYAFIARAGYRRGLLQGLIRRLFRLATNGNRVVIFQNPDDRADFIASGCLADPGKARLVNGSGVDVDHFTPLPLPSAPVFLTICRYLWTKGLDEFCSAAQIRRASGSPARFVVVGYPGTGPDAVPPEQIEAWRQSGVEFLGKLADVRPAIASCSVYVLASWREGTPRSVLEALAMARPVITCDSPGCRETVQHGVNGLLVPIRDAAALAGAMERLEADPALGAKMGLNGRKLALSKYAADLVNAAYLEHLEL